MLACRLCQNPDSHVHPTENTTARLVAFIKAGRMLQLNKITNVDWSAPAIRYGGRWHPVSYTMLESLWPLIRHRLMRSSPRPPEEDQQDGQENSERE